MKYLTLVAAGVLAVAAALAWRSSQASQRELGTTRAEILTWSNKVQDATAKLSEREAAVETLRVKQALQEADAAGLSNRISNLRSEIASSGDQNRELLAKIRSLEGSVSGLKKEQESAGQKAVQLEATIRELEAQLTARAAQLAEAQEMGRQTAEARNAAERRAAQLLQLWNDPASVRAQQRALAAVPAGGSARRGSANGARVEIQTDGRVVMVTNSVVRP